MHSIPPNNLDQLIAWIHVFSEQTTTALHGLRKEIGILKKALKGEDK